MTPADALRSCAFTLSVTVDPAQAEQALTVAAARGVSADDLAQLRAEWDELVTPAVITTVAQRCLCTHSQWRHLADHGRCQARLCGCVRYKPPAPWPSPEEQAVIDQSGIFAEEEQ